jgi:nucleoside-diphosphate-sugar epimerase
MAASRLFCFGLGYSARVLAKALIEKGWQVAGTSMEEGGKEEFEASGVTIFPFDRKRPLENFKEALSGTTHILVSVPPDHEGCPVLGAHKNDLKAMEGLTWVGYLSSVGVYGDAQGGVVNEASPLQAASQRALLRAAAERAWLDIPSLPVHVFRLAGIYGPGRSALDGVRAGTAKRIEKSGHLFSRIHVDDIAQVLMASMESPFSGSIYNVCDDHPAASSDVTLQACSLLGVEPPPLITFEQAVREMSPMALSFWQDRRKVDNQKIKQELEIILRYPDYKTGLAAVLAAEQKKA